MATRPEFTVIDGATGERKPATYVPTGIVDGDGNQYFRGGGDASPPPGGGGASPPGGDGGPASGLEGRVKALEDAISTHKTWIGSLFLLGLSAVIGSYLLLSADIRTLSKEGADRDREFVREIGEFKTDSARNFERILVRLPDDQSQRSSQQGQDQPVREGARGRPGG